MNQPHDANESYWKEYSNLQHVKHGLLGRYLGAWYAILARGGFPEVVYIETHAGKGRHAHGQPGSPLVALNTLLGHKSRDEILKGTKVLFRLVERDPANATALKQEIELLPPFPAHIDAKVIEDDCEDFLDRVISHLEKGPKRRRLSFTFVDPFGYSISISKLSRLLDLSDGEIFINFMWRFVDMAIHDDGKAASMDALFGAGLWKGLREVQDPQARCEAGIRLLCDRLGGKHHLTLKMLAENRSVKYVLIHAANHQRAFEVMKQAIWSLVPEGDFAVRQSDDPNQEFLLHAEPDLNPLAHRLWSEYQNKWPQIAELQSVVARMIYLPRHLIQLLKQWTADGSCLLPEGQRKLVQSENHTIGFVRRPDSL